MTQLEKEIAELSREVFKPSLSEEELDKMMDKYCSAYHAREWSRTNGKIEMAKKALKIIESLQAENQELKCKLEQSIKALTKIQNIAHEGFGCGSQVTYQQTAEAHEKCALEALYKINGEKQ